MNILLEIKAKYRYYLASRIERKILTLALPFVSNIVTPLTQKVREKIITENEISGEMIKLLGYVAGIIDAISQELTGTNRRSLLAADIAFSRIILILFDHSLFIKRFNRTLIDVGYHEDLSPKETVIGHLQHDRNFVTAMICGGGDYASQGTSNYFPVGLFSLGLISNPKEQLIIKTE